MRRCIVLPAAEKSVTLANYVAVIKCAIAHPDHEFKHGLTTWWPTTGAEIRRQFRRGMQDRISQSISYSLRGAK